MEASSKLTIQVMNASFSPCVIACSPNTIIHWSVVGARELDKNSLYFNATRNHVIGFEILPIESPYLCLNDNFEIQFHKPGVYEYKCLIYPAMKGVIKVIGKEGDQNYKDENGGIYTIIDQISTTESRVQSVPAKEIMEKYLNRIDCDLSPSVRLGINEEHESNLGEFESQPAIFKDLVKINIEMISKKAEMFTTAKEDYEAKYVARKSIIFNCMNLY